MKKLLFLIVAIALTGCAEAKSSSTASTTEEVSVGTCSPQVIIINNGRFEQHDNHKGR